MHVFPCYLLDAMLRLIILYGSRFRLGQQHACWSEQTDPLFLSPGIGLTVQEVPPHVVLNSGLHWGKQGVKGRWVIPDHIQGCSLKGKGFSLCSQLFLWVKGVGGGGACMFMVCMFINKMRLYSALNETISLQFQPFMLSVLIRRYNSMLISGPSQNSLGCQLGCTT